jgi:outer membrane protein, multidrug efflux system
MQFMRSAFGIVLSFVLAGCAVGPNYKRPTVDVPGAYRADPAVTGADPAVTGAHTAGSLGDAKWWTVFQDPTLGDLIRTALQQNYDVRIAAERVVQAQAQLGITRADQFPTLSAGANLNSTRNPKTPIFPTYQLNTGELNLSAAWELDFWGKYRRATEAARANLLASEWGRRAVVDTLISNVANAYFELRSLDLELDISRNTLKSRQDSLNLTQVLEQHGSTSLLDVRQSEQLVYTASETIPDLERRIEQQENLISILLGRNPGPIARGLALTDQPHPPTVPAGLPSELLERRPDIRQSEQQLIAANAEIGVAKAAYFPDISLTALGGFQSDALTRLFSGPAGLWNVGPALTQPIFTAGKIRSNVRLSEAVQQQSLLTYQQTIQQAFRDVSDSLIAYQKDREFREQQELLTASAQDATRLADVRYKSGVASYLEVLTNDTNYFSAELNLAQARLNELTDLVHLYNALGGGWEQ